MMHQPGKWNTPNILTLIFVVLCGKRITPLWLANRQTVKKKKKKKNSLPKLPDPGSAPLPPPTPLHLCIAISAIHPVWHLAPAGWAQLSSAWLHSFRGGQQPGGWASGPSGRLFCILSSPIRQRSTEGLRPERAAGETGVTAHRLPAPSSHWPGTQWQFTHHLSLCAVDKSGEWPYFLQVFWVAIMGEKKFVNSKRHYICLNINIPLLFPNTTALLI